MRSGERADGERRSGDPRRERQHGNADRDAHLRGPDFFDVDRHPMITFRSTATRPRAESTWEGTGDLTVRDVTRPVVVQVDFEGEPLAVR